MPRRHAGRPAGTRFRAAAARRLARRGYTLDLARLEELFTRRTRSITTANELRAESNRLTQQVQQAARQGTDVLELKERARQLKEQIRQADAEHDQAAGELRELLLGIPNLPLDTVPDGDSEDFAVEIRRHGDPPAFAFEPKDHVDLGEAMGILDFGRAAKLSGPRFSIARGAGAALERALASFFLDLHTRRHGYTEYSLPNLVTRGLLRIHQFTKVEMVRICAADESQHELEKMISHAEACLKELGLAYRVIVLAAGDMGFAAQVTYDLEVWLPSQHRYREISSCPIAGRSRPLTWPCPTYTRFIHF